MLSVVEGVAIGNGAGEDDFVYVLVLEVAQGLVYD